MRGVMQVRRATPEDVDRVFSLASDLATSFEVEERTFKASYRHVVTDDHALLLVVEDNGEIVGYCLGFDHVTFFANGRVAWVEEMMVSSSHRRKGVGRSLMAAFERWSAARGAKLVALATRRAAEFYRAVGYEESATYFRKML
jgi:GNAT superfamily N-acetyltransferase